MGRNAKAIVWDEEWIYNNFPNYKLLTDMHKAYCQECQPVTIGAFKSWFRRHNIHSNFSLTPEEISWIKEVYPHQSVAESTVIFNEIFGRQMTEANLRANASRLGVKVLQKKYVQPIPSAKIGTLRFWHKYWYIRTEKGWVLYHRYLYEENVGSIPDGYCVIFKDGNNENFQIENLIAIPKEFLGYLNKNGWKDELLEVGIMWCELHKQVNKGDK